MINVSRSFSRVLEPELTMTVQETTGPNEEPDAVVEYARNQGNSDANIGGM